MTPLEVLRKMAGAPRGVKRIVERWLAVRYYAWYFRRNPDHPSMDRERALEALRDADRIVFLCLGNICRSPFAERYLRRRLAAANADAHPDHERLEVNSAGVGPVDGKPSPDCAVETAAAFDVELTDHRSSTLSSTEIGDGDVVFVMDYCNFYLLAKQHPEAIRRTFFLGVFADDPESVPIVDPNGESADRFESVYETIAAAVDDVVAALDQVESGSDAPGPDPSASHVSDTDASNPEASVSQAPGPDER